MAEEQKPIRMAEARLLRDQAYEIIKEAIIDSRIKPGQEIVEADLSKSLGMSKTPVREALMQLSNDGFVEILPFKGAFVTDVATDDVRQIYEFREILEVFAVKNIVKYITDQEVEFVRRQIAYMKIASELNDRKMYDGSHQELHSFIIQKTRNKWVAKALSNLEDYVARIRMSVIGGDKVSGIFLEDYEALASAFENRDTVGAERAIKEHLKKVVIMFEESQKSRL